MNLAKAESGTFHLVASPKSAVYRRLGWSTLIPATLRS